MSKDGMEKVEKVAFRLDATDVERTERILAAQPASLAHEARGNRSMLWRLIYRAGLAALDKDPRALVGQPAGKPK